MPSISSIGDGQSISTMRHQRWPSQLPKQQLLRHSIPVWLRWYAGSLTNHGNSCQLIREVWQVKLLHGPSKAMITPFCTWTCMLSHWGFAELVAGLWSSLHNTYVDFGLSSTKSYPGEEQVLHNTCHVHFGVNYSWKHFVKIFASFSTGRNFHLNLLSNISLYNESALEKQRSTSAAVVWGDSKCVIPWASGLVTSMRWARSIVNTEWAPQPGMNTSWSTPWRQDEDE